MKISAGVDPSGFQRCGGRDSRDPPPPLVDDTPGHPTNSDLVRKCFPIHEESTSNTTYFHPIIMKQRTL